MSIIFECLEVNNVLSSFFSHFTSFLALKTIFPLKTWLTKYDFQIDLKKFLRSPTACSKFFFFQQNGFSSLSPDVLLGFSFYFYGVSTIGIPLSPLSLSVLFFVSVFFSGSPCPCPFPFLITVTHSWFILHQKEKWWNH